MSRCIIRVFAFSGVCVGVKWAKHPRTGGVTSLLFAVMYYLSDYMSGVAVNEDYVGSVFYI